MYTLFKTVGNNAPGIVGYYSDLMEGCAAIEEDASKNDDVNVQYVLRKDGEQADDD